MRHLPQVVLVALLLWVPVPFGSVTPEGVLGVLCTVCVLALLLALSGWPPIVPQSTEVRVAAACLAGLGVLGLFQASALMGRWFGFLSGDLTASVEAIEASASRGLSLAPSLTLQAALGWFSLALLFVVAVILGRRTPAKFWLLGAVVIGSIFQALYGWRQWVVAPYEILGRAVSGPPRLRGTFVNADHLAIFFEITMAVCLAWGWWSWKRSRREPRLTYRLLWFLPPVLCWLGAGAALLGTGSRAALAATAVGLVAQSALVTTRRARLWVPAAMLLVLVAGAALVVRQGPMPELGRQLSRPSYEILSSSRFAVWRPALSLWKGSPWTGTGLGTFEEAFPRVQPPELMNERWGRAHNDPLELLVTGGLVAVTLFGAALVLIVRRLWRVYREGGRSAARAAALAALAALPVVALHEGVDFGLSIPANAVTMTVLLGLGVAGPTIREGGAEPLRSR